MVVEIHSRGETCAGRQTRVAVAVRQCEAGWQPVVSGFMENSQGVRAEGRTATRAESACAAPIACHAPARVRRGFTIDSDDARPRGFVDHSDLYARAGSAPARRI